MEEERKRIVANPPTGTVTFLFTDIEGSTALWEDHPAEMQLAIERHDEILKSIIDERGGYVFKTIGDAFCAAFSTAGRAVEAALAIQRSLRAAKLDELHGIRVRMALHTGVAEERGGDYFGPPVNRVARLLSAGYGSQMLLSDVTCALARDTLRHLEPEAELRDLGEYRLRGLRYAERVHQLVVPDLPSDHTTLMTAGAWSNETRNVAGVHPPAVGTGTAPGQGTAPRASRKGTREKTLVLAVILGLLLVLLASGGAAVFAKFGTETGLLQTSDGDPSPETVEVRQAVEGHYRAIGAGDWEAAYSYFGPLYRSIKDERTWISDEKSNGIRSSKIHSLKVNEVSGDTASATVDVSFEDDTGTPRFRITWNLVKESGRWKLNEQSSAERVH